MATLAKRAVVRSDQRPAGTQRDTAAPHETPVAKPHAVPTAQPIVKPASAITRPTLGDIAVISKIPYSDTYASAIVISCADGRYWVGGDAIRDIAGDARPDRMTEPGGPAVLHALSCIHHSEREDGIERLKLLITAHGTTRVVLIGHNDCAFYEKKFPHLSVDQRIQRQLDDLRDITVELRRLHPKVRFTSYYARPHAGCVALHAVQW